MKVFSDFFSWPIVLLLIIFIGLAPFQPRPHIFEKILLLTDGQLTKPIDILDMIFHGLPFVLFLAKMYSSIKHYK